MTAVSRVTFCDDICGTVAVSHDPSTGIVLIEFERFELSDTILPEYRLTVSTEHVLAWIESLLSKQGVACRRMHTDERGKRLQAMLKLTCRDANLVFTCFQGANVILVRAGCVLKVPFALESMEQFSRRIKQDPTLQGTTTAVSFVEYVRGLCI